MGCGSCGGGISPKVIQSTAIRSTSSIRKSTQNLVPANSQKIVLQTKQKPIKAVAAVSTKINSNGVENAKIRASNTKVCPNCGALIRTILAGSGPKRRLICTSCGKQYSK